MAAEYYVVVRDTAGNKIGVITDFWGLAYSKRVNDVGLGVLQMEDDTDIVDLLATDFQFEFMRRDTDAGLDWYADFYGFLRGIGRDFVDGKPVYTATLLEQQWLFKRRIIAWYAGTDRRSTWTSVVAETIMKEIVSYNMTAAGSVAAGRLRDATMTGFTITTATDQERGNTISLGASWRGVLPALQQAAAIGGGDFRLNKTGPVAWEFEFYPNQLGADRTATVLFSLEYGNMGDPAYSLNRTDEATVAIVAGQGEADSRATAVVSGAGYSATNDIETFVDARDIESGLADRGNAELDARKAAETLDFDVLQTPASRYGVHYFLGDMVSARFRGVDVDQKIAAVHVKVDDDESVAIELET